jgi:HJR/Mrr/RecB family endonuclease
MRAVAGVLLLIFMTVALHGDLRMTLALISGVGGVWWLVEMLRLRRAREAVLQEIAKLSDSEFLNYTADLVRAQGYGVLKVGQAGAAQGNLLLMYGERSIVCRVLRGIHRLGRAEMSSTLGRMELYGGKGAMVVTNRLVSRSAARFAQRVGCIVIDRDKLVRLIGQYRQGHRVYAFQRQETAKLRRRKQ